MIEQEEAAAGSTADVRPRRDSPESESVRAAMHAAWRDHHHARDQTWRAVQMVAVIGAGLISVDVGYGSVLATVAAGALVVVSAVFGLSITMRHRDLERRKFIHITNCEERLGLHQVDLIPWKDRHVTGEEEVADEVRDGAVGIPAPFQWWSVFDPSKHNTSLFIMRVHVAILLFAMLVVAVRVLQGSREAMGG